MGHFAFAGHFALAGRLLSPTKSGCEVEGEPTIILLAILSYRDCHLQMEDLSRSGLAVLHVEKQTRYQLSSSEVRIAGKITDTDLSWLVER